MPEVLDNPVLRRVYGTLGGETPLAVMRQVFDNTAERSPTKSPLIIPPDVAAHAPEITAMAPAETETVDTVASRLSQIAEITEIPVASVAGISEKHIRRLSIVEGRNHPAQDTEEARQARTVEILREVVSTILPADTRFLTQNAVSKFFRISGEHAGSVLQTLQAQGLLVEREGAGLFVARGDEALESREDIAARAATTDIVIPAQPLVPAASAAPEVDEGDTVITASVQPIEQSTGPTPEAILLAARFRTIIHQYQRKMGGDLMFYQEWRNDRIGEGIMSGQRRGHIESFTGSRKTADIVFLAAAAVAAGQRVLILGKTVEDLDNVYGANGETGMGLIAPGLQDFTSRAYRGRVANGKAQIVEASYAGLLHEHERNSRGEGKWGKFDLILGSECQWGLGFQTMQVLDTYMPDAMKIGFSATPDFAQDRRSEQVWGKKWFQYTAKDILKFQEEARDGKQYVAPIIPVPVFTDATIRLEDPQAEFTEKELAPLIRDPERNGLIVKYAQDYIAAGRQVLIGCVAGQENLHAQVVAGLLSELEVDGRKIRVKDYGSHLSDAERAKRLAEYAAGEIDALTFTYALEEALHIKGASVMIDADETTSPRRKIQKLGRIMDPNEGGIPSIYVELIDQTEIEGRGRSKQIYSIMHALGLAHIDINRVLGRHPSDQGNYESGVDPLRRELIEQLMELQGKPLAEALLARTKRITSNRTPLDVPLAHQWERTLRILGMPAELPFDDVMPATYAREYEKAAERLRLEFDKEYATTANRLRQEIEAGGREPTHAQIVSEMKKARAVEEFGPGFESEYRETAEALGGEPTYDQILAAMTVTDDYWKGAIRWVKWMDRYAAGGEPTHEEIVAAMKTTQQQKRAAQDWGQRVDWYDVHRARMGMSGAVIDLSEPPPSVEDTILHESVVPLLQEAMADLDETHQRVLGLRFGFGEEFAAIKRRPGLSAETLRKLLTKFYTSGIERVEIQAINNLSIPKMREAMADLTDRERDVLTFRLGMHLIVDGQRKNQSLEQVAKFFGLSVDEAGDMQRTALSKLREPALIETMAELSEDEQRVFMLRFGIGRLEDPALIARVADLSEEQKQRILLGKETGEGYEETRRILLRQEIGVQYEEQKYFDGQKVLTLQEIGNLFDHSMEWARKKEQDALKNLRAPMRAQPLLRWLREQEQRPVHPEPQTVYQKRIPVSSLIHSLPEIVGTPIVDPRDPRPYLVRIKEAAEVESRSWERRMWGEIEELPIYEDKFLKMQAEISSDYRYRIGRSRQLYETRPDGANVVKVFDPNQLRAQALIPFMGPAREIYTTINEAYKRAKVRPIGTSSVEVRDAKLHELDGRIQRVRAFSILHASHRDHSDQLLASLQEERRRVASSNPDIIAEEQREATLAVLSARLQVSWSYYAGLRENYRYYMREAEESPKTISWRNAAFNKDEAEPSVDK